MGTPGFGELARVPVGLNPVELEGPHHTAVSPAGDFYYVGISNYVPGGGSGPHGAHGTGAEDGYCLKLDARDNRLVGSVRVDPNPGDVIVSADGRTLYQTHFDTLKITEVARRGAPTAEMDARLAIIDAQTMTRKAHGDGVPGAARGAPVRGRAQAYIACWSDEVAVVDLAAGRSRSTAVTRVKVATVAGTAVAPRHEPYALTVSPTTGEVWVSSMASRQVQVLDPQTRTMDARAHRARCGARPCSAPSPRTGARSTCPTRRWTRWRSSTRRRASVLREIPLSHGGLPQRAPGGADPGRAARARRLRGRPRGPGHVARGGPGRRRHGGEARCRWASSRTRWASCGGSHEVGAADGAVAAGRGLRRTPTSAVEYGEELFNDSRLSESDFNSFSCATCHATTPRRRAGRLDSGYSLYNSAFRQSWWGGYETNLLDAVNFCYVNFMRGVLAAAPRTRRRAARCTSTW